MTTGSRGVPAEVSSLWPEPATVAAARSTPAGRTGYLVVPSVRRPRLLVPLDVPGADKMLRRHAGNPAERTARRLWRLLHKSGVAGRLPITRLTVRPDPTGIEAYLGACLSRPVRVGVLLGPPRANAKPVLQVFDEAGATVAFAKLGPTPLTAALVDNEAAALSSLGRSGTRTFSAPAVLHHGRWHDIPVLVQQALDLSQSNLAPVRPPMAVMAEIAALPGISEHRLDGSDFLASVSLATEPSWHGIDMRPFEQLHAALAASGACPFGGSHGDFGPWNMGTDGNRFQVWDWERFAASVPLGFDAAHYRASQAFADDVEPARAWTCIVGDVRELLAVVGSDPALAATAARCYLLAICARYRHDAGTGPTDKLRRRMRWLSATAAAGARFRDGAYA
jgi:hypothetical protein